MENIIHLEYFEEMPSAMKHIYLAYTATGAAFYENYTTSKFKYVFGCLICFQYASVILGLAITILQQPELNLPILTSCWMYLFYMCMMGAKVVVVYWKRDTFHALFDQINELKDDDFVKPNFNFTTDQTDETDMENVNLKGLKYNIMYGIGVTVMKLSKKFLTYICSGEFVIDYLRDFIIPIPFADSQTLTSYILLHSVVFVITFFLPFALYGTIFLPVILSIHLKNKVIRLLNDMKYHSDLTFECMEECNRREEKIMTESQKCENVRRFQLQDIQKQRDRHIEEFMHKVRQWIKHHQKWISCVELFKKCVPHILSVHVIVCYVGIIGPGYNVIKMILDSKESAYDNITYVGLNIIYLFMACALANAFSEMGDDISTAIYSMPWYYLPVKHQKVLLQFLALAQDSPKIRIFKVFPVSLEQFPEVLNNAYGYIQLIRVLEMKIN